MNEEQRVAMLPPWEPDHTFVVLEGLLHRNRFFSSNRGPDPRLSAENEVWYRILGYAETVAEAQLMLYGRTY